MKKIIGIFIVTLLIATAVLPAIGSNYSKDNKDKCNMIEDLCRNSEFDEWEQNKDYRSLIDYPLMDEKFVDMDLGEASPKPTVIDTSDDFSWRDYNGKDWTTPVQDQRQECGACWAFAAIGALESVINIREECAELDPDLSEQYILSCLPSAGSCNGGSSYNAYKYMKETSSQGNYHNGAMSESCFPYQADDDIPCSDKCDNWEELLAPIFDYGYWDTDGSFQDRERIKTQVFENGPVVSHIMVTSNFRDWGKIFHDPEDYYPYVDSVSINHCVVILGWKDDSSIGKGGYWICKNSWETTWGYEGFFNIEYGSLNIDNSKIVWVDYDPDSYDWAPVTDAGGPYTGEVGEEITFDSSQSFDVEGGITSYHWDFGDGETDTGVIATHSYSQRGLYTVTLTVTDETGKQGAIETAALIDLWIKRDSWTYDIDDIEIYSGKDGESTSFKGSIKDLVFTVKDDNADYYRLDFNGKINGEIEVEAVFGNIVILGKLSRFSKMEGSITVRQSDLGIKDSNSQIRGILTLSNDLIPVPIPIPFNIELNSNFDTIYPIINFPLSIGKSWGVPSTSISIDGHVKSIMFNIMNFANKIAKLMGQELIPPDIAKFLPVIDIGDFLEEFGVENTIEIPGGPNALGCTNEEEITVKAGTFNAYKVSIVSSPWENLTMALYYAPDVANIVKISAEMEELPTPNGELTFIVHGELVSTNYGV